VYGELHIFIGVLFVLCGLRHVKFSKKSLDSDISGNYGDNCEEEWYAVASGSNGSIDGLRLKTIPNINSRWTASSGYYR